MRFSKRAACWHVDKADKLKTLLKKIIKAISAAWMLTWQMVTRVTAFPIDTAANPRYSLPLYKNPLFLNRDRKNDAASGSSMGTHMEPSDLHWEIKRHHVDFRTHSCDASSLSFPGKIVRRVRGVLVTQDGQLEWRAGNLHRDGVSLSPSTSLITWNPQSLG